MTPGARVAAAISVLDAWQAGQAVEQALTNWARSARYAGAKDRAAVRDHVFDVLRAKGSCAFLGSGTGGRALMLGLLRLRADDPAAIFTGTGHAPAPLAPAEAVVPDGLADPLLDVPGWMRPLFAARAGDDLDRLLGGLRDRAPLFLRVNTARTSVSAAIARLEAEGIAAQPDPRAATALLVTSGARAVKSAGAYLEGWVEPQDLSVQRAILAVDWPAATVLDYCAGGGGKALAIAALGVRAVVAHDADPRRMADLGPRAARAGVAIRTLATADLAEAGPFAAVLCDVPCSGSGTWRRDPEGKWRLTPERLAALVATQAGILDAAARLVGPGGRLIYMTCSLFGVENEDQISGFLARHPGWICLSQAIDTPLTASDGFFHASFQAPAALDRS